VKLVLLLKEQYVSVGLVPRANYACCQYFVIAYCKQHRRSREFSVGGA